MIALFISLAVVLVLVVVFIIAFPKIHRRKIKKNYVSIFGKKIYKYALHNDLYLINQLELKGNDDQLLKIDHLLFGNKYIYVISDYYLPGMIEAKDNDPSFIYQSYEKNSKKVYIDNLLLKGDELTKKVAFNLGLKSSLFIPIALVDDGADFLNYVPDMGDNFLCHISHFRKLIDQLEARNVGVLNDDQLKYAVKDINRLNERRKRDKSN